MQGFWRTFRDRWVLGVSAGVVGDLSVMITAMWILLLCCRIWPVWRLRKFWPRATGVSGR
jgi:phage shock protein PspC (stress-responsive transcriptional regulator)